MPPAIQRAVIYLGAHLMPDRLAHEVDRAKQRFWIGTVLAILCLWSSTHSDSPSQLEQVVPYLCALYACLSVLYMRMLQARPDGFVLTQYFFLCLDPVLSVFGLFGAPQVLAAFNPLVMVQIVRSGIRYGHRVMHLSWFLSVLAAAVLFPASTYWMKDEPALTRSFALMLAVTPLLFGPLVKHLHLLTRDLRDASTSDPLTGLGNRRMLAERLRLAQERAQRDKTMLAVMVFDLDNFKAVNDTLGHTTGDHLLEATAAALRRKSRNGDFLARVGGDEFVLLAEGLSASDGPSQAQRIADSLVETVRTVSEQVCPTIKVGTSVGVHCWVHGRNPAPHSSDLLDIADRAMYSAKRAGKGRVVMATA